MSLHHRDNFSLYFFGGIVILKVETILPKVAFVLTNPFSRLGKTKNTWEILSLSGSFLLSGGSDF